MFKVQNRFLKARTRTIKYYLAIQKTAQQRYMQVLGGRGGIVYLKYWKI
jgi:hypothetical protein